VQDITVAKICATEFLSFLKSERVSQDETSETTRTKTKRFYSKSVNDRIRTYLKQESQSRPGSKKIKMTIDRLVYKL
jgi:hypothetical protein